MRSGRLIAQLELRFIKEWSLELVYFAPTPFRRRPLNGITLIVQDCEV